MAGTSPDAAEHIDAVLRHEAQASRMAQLLAPFAAVLITLLVCAPLVAWAGAPVGRTMRCSSKAPRFALRTLGDAHPGHRWSSPGSPRRSRFRAGFYNIGAEGAALCRALAAVAVGAQGGSLEALPPTLRFVLMMLAGAAAGL